MGILSIVPGSRASKDLLLAAAVTKPENMRLAKIFQWQMVLIKVVNFIAFNPSCLSPGVYPREIISYAAHGLYKMLLMYHLRNKGN